MKRKHFFLLPLLLCAVSFCAAFFVTGCNGNKVSNDDDNPIVEPEPEPEPVKITYSQAIQIVKNSERVERAIAVICLMRGGYYSPTWGRVTAEEIEDGWKVTGTGSMIGYSDEYATKLKTATFEVVVLLNSVGTIRDVDASRKS